MSKGPIPESDDFSAGRFAPLLAPFGGASQGEGMGLRPIFSAGAIRS